MKIFLAWSGERSQDLARALRDWLPEVIQRVKPWMSEEDIQKGSGWNEEIAEQLREAEVGVLCMTPENLSSPWLHFEAGAMSNRFTEKTRVCTYLLATNTANLVGAMRRFQATKANRVDTRRLIGTINETLGEDGLDRGRLDKSFELVWPELESKLLALGEKVASAPPQRDQRDVLEEVLETVRYLAGRSEWPPVNQAALLEGLTGALSGKLPDPWPSPIFDHRLCPCGSGELFLDCHGAQLEKPEFQV